MDVKESYQVLELEIGASRAEVDAAYCRLIERCHPDRVEAGGSEAIREAQRKVEAINEAYHILAKIAPNSTKVTPRPANPAPAAAAKPKLPAGEAEPAPPAKPRLPPLVGGQPAYANTLPPTPPPAATWAARPAASANTVPPTTAAMTLPPLPPSTTPAPATGAPLPAPTLEPSTPGTLPVPPNPASAPGSKDGKRFDKLFPAGSPHRRFGPIVLAAVVITVVFLGRGTRHSSPGPKGAPGPDPKVTGSILVKSNLANATVEVTRLTAPGDASTARANGSVDRPLAGLPPGKYAVTARSEGWPEVHDEASVEVGQTAELAMNFQGGSLRLDSVPDGVTVRLGATVLGRTPLLIPLLPPGDCELTLVYPAWPVASFKTTITAGVESTGTVRLPHGKLTVESSPAGATVLQGGKPLGRTPLTWERVPAGPRKLTLQAKDFPPLDLTVTVEDHGDVKVRPNLGSGFPVLDPAALLRGIWIPDADDRIAPPLEGVTGPFQPQNGVVRNLNRKRLFDTWLRKQYCYTATVKSYDPTGGMVEFAEQQSELSKYRVRAKLSAEARNDPDLAAQLTKGATFGLYGRLTAVEEPRWPSKVIMLEFSAAEPLR